MLDTPLVTVFCMTYNQESYIRDALEGFVSQKCAFPFEVLVHDDASTDSTSVIIREYEKRYPNIIRGVYQAENQFSKGVMELLMSASSNLGAMKEMRRIEGGRRGRTVLPMSITISISLSMRSVLQPTIFGAERRQRSSW